MHTTDKFGWCYVRALGRHAAVQTPRELSKVLGLAVPRVHATRNTNLKISFLELGPSRRSFIRGMNRHLGAPAASLSASELHGY